jgi:hypothetical protein
MQPTKILTTIDGFVYTVSHAPAELAIPAAFTVARVLGPAVQSLRQDQEIMDALAYALRQPTMAADVLALSHAFAPSTIVQLPGGAETRVLDTVFSTHFAGRYDKWIEWLVAAVDHNCASFLGGLKPLLAKFDQVAEARSASNSPKGAAKTG